MFFSIIIPSYNQEKYIQSTLENVILLKQKSLEKGIQIEILLFDSESEDGSQKIISAYKSQIDYISIKKDKGQFDAINNGIKIISGDYWTWLNTDDLIDIDGFLKVAQILNGNASIDYIYGNISYISENGEKLKVHKARPFIFNSLVNVNPGIFQPGSFFKTSFTKKIGYLKEYNCCFDYEYILRCLNSNAQFYCCDFSVASFRSYDDSKTGRMIPVFIKEQLEISAKYGRRLFSFLTWFSYLRLVMHKLFPRK